MLSKRAAYALKALLELAAEPESWRSTHALASAQKLPEPMLEQIMLRLRRAGLVVARRGRLGGYRLAMPGRNIQLSTVLTSLREPSKRSSTEHEPASASDQVTRALDKKLEAARHRGMNNLTIEDMMFDLRSAETCPNGDTGIVLS